MLLASCRTERRPETSPRQPMGHRRGAAEAAAATSRWVTAAACQPHPNFDTRGMYTVACLPVPLQSTICSSILPAWPCPGLDSGQEVPIFLSSSVASNCRCPLIGSPLEARSRKVALRLPLLVQTTTSGTSGPKIHEVSSATSKSTDWLASPGVSALISSSRSLSRVYPLCGSN